MSFTRSNYLMIGIQVDQKYMDRKYPYLDDPSIDERHAYCNCNIWNGVAGELASYRSISIMDESNTYSGKCHIGLVLSCDEVYEKPEPKIFSLSNIVRISAHVAEQIDLLFPDDTVIQTKLQSVGLVHFQMIL